MSNEDFDTFDSPADENQGKQNLSEILHNNPSLKIFAIVAAIGVVAAGVLLFSGGDDELPISRMAAKSDVTEIPGGTERLPPNYEEALDQKDRERMEQAARTGGSVLPTPRSGGQERIEAPVLDSTEDDPLEIWRRQVEADVSEEDQRRDRELDELAAALESVQDESSEGQGQNQDLPPLPQPVPMQVTAPVAAPLPASPTVEQIEQRSQQVAAQMQTILETKVPEASQLISLGAITPEQLGINNINALAEGGAGLAQPVPVSDISSQELQEELKPVIMPGDIAYAQMLTEANSDIPGPVLAYIASGPLAGARALGTFSSTEEYLTITFNTAVLDREQYAINAYAVDPETTLTGMATSVDNHYFSRVVIPAAAAFLEGFADAVTDQGQTTVVVSGDVVTSETQDLELEDELLEGASEGISEIASIVDDNVDDEPTVVVSAGTRFGLLFMQPVFKTEEDSPF